MIIFYYIPAVTGIDRDRGLGDINQSREVRVVVKRNPDARKENAPKKRANNFTIPTLYIFFCVMYCMKKILQLSNNSFGFNNNLRE